jgi:DNA-binding LacI/PurR family transcriptional regulator
MNARTSCGIMLKYILEVSPIVTRKEVAQLAGVSEATVSRVFNSVGPMKEETRQRVMAAAEQLQYTPNALAQQFVRKRSNHLGVVLPLLPKIHLFATHYFAEILSGIGQKANELGYDLLLLFANPEQSMDYVHMYQSRKVDALLFLGSKDVPKDRMTFEQLIERRLPFCLIGQRFDDLELNSVDADHEQGSFEVVDHLIKQGHHRIAFVNGPLEFSNSRDRLQGYRRALKENGIPYDPEMVYEGNYSRKSGYALAETFVQLSKQIGAVYAANDRMALGLMQGLKERGIKVGEQLVIAGYDNTEASRFSDPDLTSVSVPLFEMGQTATEQLLSRMDGGTEGNFTIKLPAQLIERSSSRLINY